MKNKTLINVLFLAIACLSFKKANVEKKLSVYLYFRAEGSNNECVSYSDDVVLDPYKNGKFTIQQLATIARNYIDTVKADKPVSGVTFIGKRMNSPLPSLDDVRSEEYQRYLVATFGFDNGIPAYAGNKNPDLDYIAIWRNGEPIDFIFASKKDPKFHKRKKIVDSLLNCNIPINTNFK